MESADFGEALSQWSKAEFGRWKEKQDKLMAELEAEESAMLTSRRNLVKQTKEVKTLPDEEQFEKLKELLKVYQQEIDGLATRVKTSIAVQRDTFEYTKNLPDPLPALQCAMEQACNVADNKIFQQENADLRKALEDISVRARKSDAQLEEISKERDRTVMELQQQLNSKESSLHDLHSALSEQERQCMVLTNRNEEVVIELSRLKKAYEDLQKETESVTRLRSQQDNLQLAELDVVNLTAEASRQQIMELQRENELLRAELETRVATPADERRIRVLEEDILDLQGKLLEEQNQAKGLIRKRDEEIAIIKAKLETLCDTERSLDELRMLKAAEFPDLYNPTNDQSLESLLQQKNKKLESDLVQMRNGNRDLQSQLKKMAANLDELQKKNAETEKIIARYEDSAAIAAMPGDNNSIKSASTEHVTLPSADSIVVVLTNQRDRLKKQNNELEERLATINKQLDSQKQESNRLQADNVKLFERIKYIEAFANKKTPAKENVDTELGDLLPYQNIYEERLDPFRLFFQNEVVKRFKSLGKTDRTVWKLGRVFLTNKFIRRFMVTYFALLHIILLYMLLRSPSTAAVVVTKH